MLDEYLDKMDEMLEEVWNLPFSGGRGMVDVEKMKGLIDDVRLCIPNEVKQAKVIVADRADIIRDAQREAEEIIKKAEQKARLIVSEQEVTRTATEKAAKIVADAGQKYKEMQKAATAYSQDTLRKSEEALLEALNTIKKARAAITGAKK